MMHIHFKQLGITKYSRGEFIDLANVIGEESDCDYFEQKYSNKSYGFPAACGGIIGLCMGFSLLSGVELIYFFTLRMWVDHRRIQRQKNQVAGLRA